MFTVLSTTQKSFSVILMLAVTFTVVIFGQIYCRNVYSLLIQSSLFGHLDSVILTSLSTHRPIVNNHV